MTFLGIKVGFALDAQVLDEIRKEVMSLEDGAGDVWDYSGSGGYIFRFKQDVLSDGASESFVNLSVRPNVWHVFTGSDSKNYIGDVTIGGSGFQLRRNDDSATIIRVYEDGAFEKYIIEQKITAIGIQKSARKVGEQATEEEYQAVLNRRLSDGTEWVAPKMKGILLYDLLNQPSPDWFDFDPDKAQVRNGYYRLPGDEGKISAFQSTFTPKVALEALNHKLAALRPTEDEAAWSLDSPARSTPTPAIASREAVEESTPRPTTSPTQVTSRTESSSGFPTIPVAIFVAVILGIVIYVLRRKSK